MSTIFRILIEISSKNADRVHLFIFVIFRFFSLLLSICFCLTNLWTVIEEAIFPAMHDAAWNKEKHQSLFILWRWRNRQYIAWKSALSGEPLSLKTVQMSLLQSTDWWRFIAAALQRDNCWSQQECPIEHSREN